MIKDIRIIGIGNPFAGDDAIGLHVVRLLQTDHLQGVDISEVHHVGVELLDRFEGSDMVILIDAVQSGETPGTIHCVEYPPDMDEVSQLAAFSQSSSTHAFGLCEVLALAETLGQLPPHVILFGIELDQTKMGEPPSPKVIEAGEQVRHLIHQRLQQDEGDGRASGH